MAMLGWAMMGLAIWHFTIFLPDRFWGGIVGACLGALVGAVLVAILLNGLALPSREETDLVTALQGVPGAIVGIAATYLYGARRERQATEPEPA